MQQIIWDVDPEIFRIGIFRVRWYGLFFSVSILLSYLISRKFFQKRTQSKHEILFLYVIIGTIVGARLGHCFVYNPAYYLGHPIEILKFWNGGLASHGGAVGIVIALFIFSRQNPEFTFLWLLDKSTLVAGLNGFFIRLGNLFNSKIIGIPTTVPWAFVFKRIDDIPRHPVQLYESFAYGLIFMILMFFYHFRKDTIKPGFVSGLFFVLVFSTRFMLEFFKTRLAEYDSNLSLSTGQLLSIPFCIAGIILIVCSRKHKTTPFES